MLDVVIVGSEATTQLDTGCWMIQNILQLPSGFAAAVDSNDASIKHLASAINNRLEGRLSAPAYLPSHALKALLLFLLTMTSLPVMGERYNFSRLPNQA